MDKMKITFILILNCLIIIGTTCFAATGIVNAPNGLVLRKEAEKGADAITTISDKTSVEILGQDGEWYKVKYNDSEGYLFSEFVDVEEEKAEEEETKKENEILENQEENAEEPKIEEENEDETNETSIYPKEQIIKENTKIYLMPSVTSKVIANAEKDAGITINYEVGSWLNITFENTNGWARKYFVIGEVVNDEQEDEVEEEKEENAEENKEDAVAEEKTVESKKGYVDGSSVNIRNDASTSAEIINTLLRNTEITIIGEKGDFYKIEYQDITGYISKSLVSDSPVETVTSRGGSGERTEASVPSGDNSIVGTASSYLGYSYSYGGSNPSTGFDCSGFAQYVYSSCGYSIGRTCTSQLNYGTEVSKDELQAGDLVFFNNSSDGSVGHVGIYVGGGNIIHAENPRTGVRTDTIDSGYYGKYYYTARRIVN